MRPSDRDKQLRSPSRSPHSPLPQCRPLPGNGSEKWTALRYFVSRHPMTKARPLAFLSPEVPRGPSPIELSSTPRTLYLPRRPRQATARLRALPTSPHPHFPFWQTHLSQPSLTLPGLRAPTSDIILLPAFPACQPASQGTAGKQGQHLQRDRGG